MLVFKVSVRSSVEKDPLADNAVQTSQKLYHFSAQNPQTGRMIRNPKSKHFQKEIPKDSSQQKLLSNVTNTGNKELHGSGVAQEMTWHRLARSLAFNTHSITSGSGVLRKEWENQIKTESRKVWAPDNPEYKQKHMAPWSRHKESAGCFEKEELKQLNSNS